MAKKPSNKQQNNKKPIFKQWWFWVIIAVVIVGVVAAVGSGNKDAKKVEGDNSSQTSKPEEKTRFKVGETFEIDEMQLSVDKVERKYTPKYNTAKEGKEFIRATVTYTNKSSRKQSYNTYDWKIGDSTGNLASETFAMDEPNPLNSGELQSNGTHSGTMVFEVPADDQALTLHYTPNILNSNREVVVELQ